MAAAGQLARIGGIERLVLALLWLAVAAGGLVFREPAPYDLLMIMMIGGCVVAGIQVPRRLAILFVLLSILIAGAAGGSAQATLISNSTTSTLVTLFLASSAIFIACIVAWDPVRVMPVIVSAWALGALIAALAAIIGYFSLLPGAEEMFTLYGRAKGTFKDPNVMGPFLILPLIFGVHRLVTRPLRKTWFWPPVVVVLLAGVFLSFSRGAWAHLVFSLLVYVGLFLVTSTSARARARLVGACIVAAIVAALALAWLLSLEQVAILFAERASLEQSYDVGAQGRFAGQRLALKLIVNSPFGIGATQFEFYNSEQVHNVYLNMFLHAGWAGGFAYLALVLVTFVKGLKLALRRGVDGLYLAIFATFAGVALEGLIVDTDHWRHFYLLLGLIWGVVALRNGGNCAPRPPHANKILPAGKPARAAK
ncbi:MAG: O-antigen ligase family protein [Alphaproteobacteria bacterium]